MAHSIELVSQRIEVADSVEAVTDLFYEQGWTDGLPVIPPTEDRVMKMVAAARRQPQDVIATIPPRLGEATVEKVAINAVMAGCLPEYMPVIIAAIEAMAEPEFGLLGIQATTHPAAPLVIVNGPIRHELKINSGHNVFGQGTRANVTIGRAIRLILVNIGGGIPGKTDMAVHGQPSKLSYCIAENEERNPWEPLHVERGFDPVASTVTLVGCESPHNVNDHASTDAEGILTSIASTMSCQGHNHFHVLWGEPMVVLGPEHAATIAKSGFSKRDVKMFLFEAVGIKRGQFPKEFREHRFPDLSDDAVVRIASRAEDIMVIVTGGAGKHSLFIPTFGAGTTAVTKPVAT